MPWNMLWFDSNKAPFPAVKRKGSGWHPQQEHQNLNVGWSCLDLQDTNLGSQDHKGEFCFWINWPESRRQIGLTCEDLCKISIQVPRLDRPKESSHEQIRRSSLKRGESTSIAASNRHVNQEAPASTQRGLLSFSFLWECPPGRKVEDSTKFNFAWRWLNCKAYFSMKSWWKATWAESIHCPPCSNSYHGRGWTQASWTQAIPWGPSLLAGSVIAVFARNATNRHSEIQLVQDISNLSMNPPQSIEVMFCVSLFETWIPLKPPTVGFVSGFWMATRSSHGLFYAWWIWWNSNKACHSDCRIMMSMLPCAGPFVI